MCTTQKPLKRVHIEDIGGEQEPPTSSQLPSDAGERLREKQTKTTPVTTPANSQSAHASPKSSGTTSESKIKVVEVETPCDTDKYQPSNQNTAPLITELREESASSSRVEITAQSDGERTRMEVVKETQNDSITRNGTTLPADVSDQDGQHSVVVPDVPDTSLQFQADWKRLKRDSNALTTYFKVLVYIQCTCTCTLYICMCIYGYAQH